MAAEAVWMLVIISASGVQVQTPTTYYSAADCQAAAQSVAQAHPGSRGSCVEKAAPPGLAKQRSERDWQAGKAASETK